MFSRTTGSTRRGFLQGAGLFAAGSMLPSSIARALAIPADRRTGTIDDVDHVVILTQENRSFDHYYGSMRGVRGFADPHPVPLPGADRNVWHQKDASGRTISPFHLDTKSTAALKITDLPHSWQDAAGAAHGGRWDDWIRWKTPLTMGYYRRQDIPYQFALAEAFTICDAYHCSVHGQTNPNRLFMWAGGNDPRATGGGPVIGNDSGVALDYEVVAGPQPKAESDRHNIDLHTYGRGPRYTFTTYPERLEKAGVSWKVYQDPHDNFWGLTNPAVAFQVYNDAKLGEALHDQAMARNTIDDLKADALAGRLPQVVWIAPPQSSSEHPIGSSPAAGAEFIASVLDALTTNPRVWARTALFINFDENDGFFDHVTPPSPPALNPDGTRAGASTVDYADDIHTDDGVPYGLSVRVPMIVVSPWSVGGWVNSQTFDHTSVIRFLEKRFGVIEPNITPWRRAVCGDLTTAFDFSKAELGSIALPDTNDAARRIDAALHLPKPAPPERPESLFQESGTRPSRALPYSPAIRETVTSEGPTILFGNPGSATIVYQVHDLTALDMPPRHFTVEPGKTLTDQWRSIKDHYHLQIRGPNGWFRELRGAVSSRWTASTQDHDHTLAIRFPGSERPMVRDRLSGNTVAIGDALEGEEVFVPLPLLSDWYDVEVSSGEPTHFYRRLCGRIETGRHSTSRPKSQA